MCSPNQEYQYINPSTQVALHSDCVGGCPSLRRIEWRVYQGDNDTLTNTIKWKPFVKQNSSNSSYFYGTNTSDFTAVNNLFLHHAEISYWSFEVVYTFLQENSTSALNFIINQCPVNGSCSIDPSSGTTTTLFTVNCSGWIDQDPIKDYSLYSKIHFVRIHEQVSHEILGWKSSSSERMMIAFSTMLIFQVRLPVGDRNTSLLHLMVEIRDLLNCVAEFKMDPLVVTQNTQAMDEFIDSLDYSNVGNTKNVLVDLLTSGHPNTVSQVAMVVAQVLHTRNEENLENALNSK